MHFLSWARCLTSTMFLYAFMKYQEADGIKTTPHPKDCIYNDSDGNIYNLTTIRNSDGTPRFELEALDYPYDPAESNNSSFNPCISFTLGPRKGELDCQSDVAICNWDERINYYQRIGSQSSVQFGFYKETKIPALHYSSDQGLFCISIVLLTCNVNDEEGTFILWKGDGFFCKFVFNLTHKCACPNACLVKLKEPTAAPSAVNILVKRVALGVGGAVLFIIVTFIIAVIFPRKLVDSCRRLFRRQPNDEQRAILGENRGAEIDTEYNIPPRASGGSELVPGRGSSCSDITVPNKKDDLNAKNKMRNVHFGDVL